MERLVGGRRARLPGLRRASACGPRRWPCASASRTIARSAAPAGGAGRARSSRALKLTRPRGARSRATSLAEIRSRLGVPAARSGCRYLSLDRAAPTLSGGEAQRIRLAAQLGSNLRGVCYILDEPTIGLHARDNRMLLDTLRELEAKGNTVVVVEHDEETIRRAEHVIDLGPGRGRARRPRGGRRARCADLMRSPDVAHRPLPARRRCGTRCARRRRRGAGARGRAARSTAPTCTTSRDLDVAHPARPAGRASPA